jgi:O-antigen ligase
VIAFARAEAIYLGALAAMAAVLLPMLWLYPLAAFAMIPALGTLAALAWRPAWTPPFVFVALMVSDGVDLGVSVGVVLTVGKLGMIFVLTAWALHCLIAGRWPFDPNALWVAHGAVLGSLILGLVPGRFVDGLTLQTVFGFVLLGVMMQVVVATSDLRHLRPTLLAIALAYIAVVVASIPLGREIVGGNEIRNAGFGGNPNQWALSVLMGLGPAVAILEGQRSRWLRWGAPLALAVGAVSILGTVSRGGLLVLLGLSPLFAFLLWRRKLALGGFAVAALLAGPLLVDLSNVSTRMDSFFDEGEMEMDGSLRDRSIVARFALDSISERPIFGLGTGSFAREVEVASGGQVALVAHNTYLGILAEQGLVGGLIFFSYLCYFAVLLWGAYRRQPSTVARRITVGLTGTLIAYVVGAVTIDALYHAPAAFWFAVIFVWSRLTELPRAKLEEAGLA